MNTGVTLAAAISFEFSALAKCEISRLNAESGEIK